MNLVINIEGRQLEINRGQFAYCSNGQVFREWQTLDSNVRNRLELLMNLSRSILEEAEGMIIINDSSNRNRESSVTSQTPPGNSFTENSLAK